MKVYMFWHSYPNSAPDIVRLCIKMWRELHPDWDVHVINGDECDQILSEDFSADVLRTINITQKSDLLRLKLLSQTGGIWSDATGLPLENISSWIEPYRDSDFSTPVATHPQRRISQWFIIARPSSFIISSLYETVMAYWSTSKIRLPTDEEFLPIIDSNFREYISDHSAHVLRIYPYFFLNYLFIDKLGKDSAFSNAFSRTPQIPYVGKGGFSSALRSFRNASSARDNEEKLKNRNAAISVIENGVMPLAKMSWKSADVNLPVDLIEEAIIRRREKARS